MYMVNMHKFCIQADLSIMPARDFPSSFLKYCFKALIAFRRTQWGFEDSIHQGQTARSASTPIHAFKELFANQYSSQYYSQATGCFPT